MSKPAITLKIGGGGSQHSTARSPSVANGTPTPSSAAPKIRLNMSKSLAASEAVATPVQKTKAGRASKPSAKAADNNKNGKRFPVDSDDEDEYRQPLKLQIDKVPTKKIKLNLGAKTPIALKAKFKGKAPKRPLGEGYDSEASDREADPLIEEEFVLRMLPGDDCEYLRKSIQDRTIGIPRHQGGADVQMKFIHAEGRRAIVTIRGNKYAATLVDLPCVIEGMKSWDKRGWWKSADICQMLLVFAPIQNDEEAATIDLPKIVDPQTFQYPHGLTPPMHFARKRRFRKRISRTAIEAVEDAVEKLLEADARAESIRHELVEPEKRSRRGSGYGSPGVFGEEYSEDEEADAEGDMDDQDEYFNQNGQMQEQEEYDGDLHADLEADLLAAIGAEFDTGTPASPAPDTPSAALATGTPEPTSNVNGETVGESSDESVEDDDDDDGSSDIDEDQRAEMAQRQGALEDIADMKKQLEGLHAQLETANNHIIANRIKANIAKIKENLQLRRSAIGLADDE